MKLVYNLMTILVVSSCQFSPGQSPAIVGKWKMTHFYADIGDGKGTWQEADKQNTRTIEFKKNGEFIDSQKDKTGKYALLDSTHVEIKDNSQSYKMTIVELGTDLLVVKANCIEGCGEKYVRIK